MWQVSRFLTHSAGPDGDATNSNTKRCAQHSSQVGVRAVSTWWRSDIPCAWVTGRKNKSAEHYRQKAARSQTQSLFAENAGIAASSAPRKMSRKALPGHTVDPSDVLNMQRRRKTFPPETDVNGNRRTMRLNASIAHNIGRVCMRMWHRLYVQPNRRRKPLHSCCGGEPHQHVNAGYTVAQTNTRQNGRNRPLDRSHTSVLTDGCCVDFGMRLKALTPPPVPDFQ